MHSDSIKIGPGRPKLNFFASAADIISQQASFSKLLKEQINFIYLVYWKIFRISTHVIFIQSSTTSPPYQCYGLTMFYVKDICLSFPAFRLCIFYIMSYLMLPILHFDCFIYRHTKKDNWGHIMKLTMEDKWWKGRKFFSETIEM